MAQKGRENTYQHEKSNWYIHACYIRHDHNECMKTIDDQLRANPFSEFPIYVKGLVSASRRLVVSGHRFLIPRAAC